VSYSGLAIYIEKYLKAQKQRRIIETQIFHHPKILSSKNPLKETKILPFPDIINSIITNLKF
jgi:hypothetical protein